MFDYLYYEGAKYQTKDTPAQGCDNYKIENGELWYENYESEWVEDKERFLGGYIHQFNERWECCHDFDGVIDFYREDKENGGYKNNAWIEYHSLFMDGKMIKLVKKE